MTRSGKRKPARRKRRPLSPQAAFRGSAATVATRSNPVTLAQQAVNAGDIDGAIDILKTALQQGENTYYVLNSLGEIYLYRKEYEESCRWLTQ